MAHDYHHDLYDGIGDSPLQEHFRRTRPWPTGVVFIQTRDMSEDDIRGHFRLMREMGFNCLKQCIALPDFGTARLHHIALDEGIIPWWFGEAAWEEPTPQLLGELGIDPGITRHQLRSNPLWIARQTQRLRAWAGEDFHMGAFRAFHGDSPHKGLPGTLPPAEWGLDPAAASAFTQWLRERYQTVEALRKAWNCKEPLIKQAVEVGTWEELEPCVIAIVNDEKQEYRRIVDVLRFKADMQLANLRRRSERCRDQWPFPVRAGGEMSLFLPFASRGTDFEGIGETMRDFGVLYPSIHPAWHHEEVMFEYLRPAYMQAAMCVDFGKGVWSAPIEATGGPQQLSGGKAPFFAPVRDQVAGFTIDADTLTQLMLTWIAAGFKGWGLWCWNARTAGWEAGEFALLDRANRPCARTHAAARVAKAALRHSDELWQAHREPVVGVFQDFEADAFWAALSRGGRDVYKYFPVFARIGAARLLIDHNIPHEYVTARNLRAGLAPRYPVIYFPAALAVDEQLLVSLLAYVEQGGRVVMDAPGAWYGYDGRVLSTREGSAFERLFGCRIRDYQFSRANHRQWTWDGIPLEGFALDLEPTSASVVSTFHDGLPAVTSNAVGRGSAHVVACDVALQCRQPGNRELASRMANILRGDSAPPFVCAEAVVHHLAAPAADHYFLFADGEPVQARLRVTRGTIESAIDVLGDVPVDVSQPIEIGSHQARWLRIPR